MNATVDHKLVITMPEEVLGLMGYGWRLRLPHDGSQATLVVEQSDLEPIPVPYHIVGRILYRSPKEWTRERARMLRRFDKEDVAAKDGGSGWIGWQSLGLDGDKADFYCMLQ